MCPSRRIRKRREFLELYRNGEKIHTPFFVVYIKENGLPESRLGITASRKIGKHVVRNRIRRRLKEIFRKERYRIEPNCDVVVNVKRQAVAANHSDLGGAFVESLSRWRRRKEAGR